MNIKQFRDVTVIEIDDDKCFGVSCDSCGGVGEKLHDFVQAPYEIVGEQTAKVALAEILSMGFEPIMLSDGLSIEMDGAGERVINGIKNTVNLLNNNNLHITGSTEENIPTVQTSIGITAIGIASKNKIKYAKTISGDILVSVGLPFVGLDVIKNIEKVMSIRDFEILSKSNFVKEIIPIGSKGIRHEIEEIKKCNDLEIEFYDEISIDFDLSGGPSCCCILSIAKTDLEKLRKIIDKPIEILGEFKKEKIM